MELDTYHFKDLLLAEQSTLEGQLETVGRKNSQDPSDWEASLGKEDSHDRSDETEVADSIEQLQNNAGILVQLETRLGEVKGAIERIENDTYGICEFCEAPIELERLEADPTASTCKAHMEE
jgi:RNA polymerase-binding transcription factor DksA